LQALPRGQYDAAKSLGMGYWRMQIFVILPQALKLVNWKSKKLWKSIPMSEVNIVQQKFEENVKAVLNVEENPFELIYEGELDKQR